MINCRRKNNVSIHVYSLSPGLDIVKMSWTGISIWRRDLPNAKHAEKYLKQKEVFQRKGFAQCQTYGKVTQTKKELVLSFKPNIEKQMEKFVK